MTFQTKKGLFLVLVSVLLTGSLVGITQAKNTNPTTTEVNNINSNTVNTNRNSNANSNASYNANNNSSFNTNENSNSVRVKNTSEPLLDKEKTKEIFSEIIDGISEAVAESIVEEGNEQFVNPETAPNVTQTIEEVEEEILNFSDVGNNPHKEFILLMKKKGIVKGYNDKFYPDQDVKFYMLAKVLVETYRARVGYRLESNLGLTQSEYFPEIESDQSIKQYINTAYELGFFRNLYLLQDEKPNLEKTVDGKLLGYILSVVSEQIPELVDRNYLNSINFNGNTVKKDELAEIMIRFFQITENGENISDFVFDDTKYHPHGASAEILAQYNIVNTNNPNFFIDAQIYRADFVVMLVNSRLAKNHKSISRDRYNTTNIADLGDKSYLPMIEFAKQQGFIDYLLETKRGQEYFYPQKLLTKHEAYYILNQTSNSDINYDTTQADQQNITRGEIASLLVDSFNLDGGNIQTQDNNSISSDSEIISNTNDSLLTQNQDTLFQKLINFLKGI